FFTVTGTSGAEFEFETDGTDFTNAILRIGSNVAWHAGNFTPSTKSDVGHTHTESDITDLGNYATVGHSHTESDITDLGNYTEVGHSHTESDITDLGNYSVVGHSHAISDVTNLQTELNGKSDTGHTHTESEITDLGNYAVVGHSHAASDVTSGSFDLARISQSSVTQHQSALSITESQISDFGTYIPTSQKGSANGVATLGGDSKIPSAQLPAIALGEMFVVADNTARDALTVQEGDIAKVTSTGITWIYDGTSWIEMTATSAVDSVNGDTGTVVLNTGDIGEGSNLYYTIARANTAIDNRVDNAFVDALNVDADTVDGQHASAFAAASHTHTESEITDLGNYAVVGHSHSASDVTSGTFLNARISQSSVTQHQAALSITESQISDLDHYTSSDFDTDFSGKTTTNLTEGTNLYYTTGRANTAIDARVTKTFVDALNVDADTVDGQHASAFASSSHTHTESEITDLGDYLEKSGGTLTGSLTVDTYAKIEAPAGLVVGNDVTITSTQGSNWPQLRLIDGSSGSETGAYIRSSTDSGTTWTDVLIATGGEFSYMGDNVWHEGNFDPTSKSNVGHTHTESDITDLGNYAVVGHSHTISDVTNLQSSLDSKVDENTAITAGTATKITYDTKG
ncbi:MAG: hypothetical protein LC650_02925, partial [Actinobacteria bacterium]|nr:hypothetical protein [Actinomycetota bacterium]